MSLSGPPNNPLFYAVTLAILLTVQLTEVANAIQIPGLPGPPIINHIAEIGIGNPITSGQYEIQFHPSLYDGLIGSTQSGTPSNDLSYQVFMYVKPITSTTTVDYVNSHSKLLAYGSFLIADHVESAWIVPENCHYYQEPIPPSSTTTTTTSHTEDIRTNLPVDQLITIRIDTTTSTCAHLYPNLTSMFINNSTSTSSSSSSASVYVPALLQLGVAARNPYGVSTWHQRAVEINVTTTATFNSGATLLSVNPEASNAAPAPASSNNTNNHTVPISILLGVVIPMFVLMLLGGGMLYRRVRQLSKSTIPVSTTTSFISRSSSSNRLPNINHNNNSNDDGLFIPNPAVGEPCSPV